MKKLLKIMIICFGLVAIFNAQSVQAKLKSSPIDDQGPTKPPPKKDKK